MQTEKVKLIGSFDPSPLVTACNELSDLKIRKAGGGPGKELYFIRDHRLDKIIDSTIRDNLEPIYGPFRYSVNINILKPGKQIYKHTDNASDLNSFHCIHMILQTNPKAEMIYGDERYHMEKAKMYEINNYSYEHSVENNGDTNRIHIMVDLNTDG